MASSDEHRHAACPFLLLLLCLLVSTASAGIGSIATYWGQNKKEGKLSKACDTGNYDYVSIAYLTTFGAGQSPALDLSGHCGASHSGGCSGLGHEIKACQKRGVKVLLSLGGKAGQQSLNSTEDARRVAAYLYDNFLGGKSASRPFGDAVLDGVDFSVARRTKKERMHWEDLVKAIAAYRSAESKIYLTAAPQCVYPDKTLKKALETGLFDAVWIRFFNHAACRYSEAGLVPLKMSWERWNSKLQTGKVFLGLPASAEAAESGYVPPENFTSVVLPYVSSFPKYGGITLWDRYFDSQSKYSDRIKLGVKQSDQATSSI